MLEDCYVCRGTGIGRYGPVDKSRCSSCKGTGRFETNAEEYYEKQCELKFELMREREYEREGR